MRVEQKDTGYWVIIHGDKEVATQFNSEADALEWADRKIDDQVFDKPNWLSGPLIYRETATQD